MVEAIFTEILNPYRQGTPFEMFKNRFTSVLTCAFAASLALAGCAISGNPNNSKATVTAQEQGKELKSGAYTSNTKNGEKIDAQTHFTQEDVTWNQDAVLPLNLADPTNKPMGSANKRKRLRLRRGELPYVWRRIRGK